MYVIADVELTDLEGNEESYQVGADVEVHHLGTEYGYEVCEPDVSAAGSSLRLSRIVNVETLAPGWSDVVQEALIEAYLGKLESLYEDSHYEDEG